MRQQRGCISVMRGNWCLRWRETVSGPSGAMTRVFRFKVLGPVTPEHKRSKDRATGKLRVPKEIQQEADGVMAAVNSNRSSTVSVLLRVAELVETHYFPEKGKHLKPSTTKGYKDIYKLHLKDRIGDMIVRDIKRHDCFFLYEQIARSNPHLTGRTMQHVRCFLSGIFKFAKDRGWYQGENPCRAGLPEGLPKGKETGFYSLEEIARILSLLANVKAQAVVSVAFGGGLRKGEIAGLRWEDMEATERGAVIHVRRSVWNGKVSTPKTESSRDDAHVDAAFVEYVEAYRAFMGGVNEGFMFGNAERPIHLDSFARWSLKPVLKAAGIEWKGWHAFRRGLATESAKIRGANVAALMLRHSSVSTTQAHYIKDTAQERRAAGAQRAAEIIGQRQTAAEEIGESLKRVTIQ